MDSLSQVALGAAVGMAVMGRRTALWKAALWGAVCGTLPDLDAFIDHGDPIRNMTFHRAESHALFWLTLASPFIAAAIAKLHGEWALLRRWWLAVWLVLITHPLLDWMTVYGTQLFLPFTDRPFGLGSIFIIDPLYTVPLLVGVIAALVLRGVRGLRWNHVGLALSCLYLAWSAGAQQQVRAVAETSLQQQGIDADRLLVTPTPFNTVLWRVLAISGDTYHEGFYSLLDAEPRIGFDSFPRGMALYEATRDDWHVARMAWFTHGFFRMARHGDELRLTDLRMGQEPHYSFTFVVARLGSDWRPVTPELVGMRPDIERGFDWLWRRLRGEQVPRLQ